MTDEERKKIIESINVRRSAKIDSRITKDQVNKKHADNKPAQTQKKTNNKKR